MKDNNKNWNWLLSIVPELQKESVLDDDSAERLSALCRKRLEEPEINKFFLPVMAVAGCLLIAAGIILIFNYNWDMLSEGSRAAIAFLPLLSGAGLALYTLIKDKGIAWREGSALISAAGANTAAALIAQIYHTGGSLDEFAVLMLLTTIFPLMYIFNSRALALICPVWLFMSCNGEGGLIAIVMLGLYGLYLYKLIRDGGRSMIFARYMFVVVWIYDFILFGHLCSALYCVLTAILFMIPAEGIYAGEKGFFNNPWLGGSFILSVIILCYGSFENDFFTYTDDFSATALTVYVVIVLAVLVLWGAKIRRKLFSLQDVFCMLFLAIAIAGCCQAQLPYEILCSLLLAAWGVYLFIRGVRGNSLLSVNGGMIMLALLILCRFFDSAMGLLPRACGFIAAGLAVIAANILISRKIKREVCSEEK